MDADLKNEHIFWQWALNDKTLLVILILSVLIVWVFIREPKLFDLINLFAGALIALITGQVLRRNGNGNGTGTANK